VLTTIAEKKILDDNAKAALEASLKEFGKQAGSLRAAAGTAA